MSRSERGAVTLEAAILFPAFLSFIFIFIIFIRLIVLEMVIQSAAGETVKQLSGVLYPFEAQLRQAGNTIDAIKPSELDFIPDTAKQWLDAIEEWKKLPDAALQQAVGAGVKPIVWSHVPEKMRGSLLTYERLKVTRVSIPYIHGDRLIFGVELQYNVPISLPFFRKELMIRESAYERVWFGS